MGAEQGRASEALGVSVLAPLAEQGRNERGYLLVARYDEDQSSWLSKQLGGERAGRPGFIQPGPADFNRYRVRPYSETMSEHSNLITTGGWDRMLTLAIGGGGTTFASASLRIGVGTGTAAAASGNTDLNAATGAANRCWVMVTGAPVVGTGTAVRRLSYVGTVGTGDGIFAWAEWGSDQGTASGVGAATAVLLNRAVSPQGTKASGQTWTATALLDWT